MCAGRENARLKQNVEEFCAYLRPGVKIVNVARGGLLDYDAVKAGLDDGQIGGLGLDVQWSEPFDPDDPIAKHPKYAGKHNPYAQCMFHYPA